MFNREISKSKQFKSKMMELIDKRERLDEVHVRGDREWQTWLQKEIISQRHVIGQLQVGHEKYMAEVDEEMMKLQTENVKGRDLLENIQGTLGFLSSDKSCLKCAQLLQASGTDSSAQLASTVIQNIPPEPRFQVEVFMKAACKIVEDMEGAL